MTESSDKRLLEYYERQIGYVKNRMAKGYKKTPPADVDQKTWLKRQRVWRHNSFIGHVVMMRTQLNAIIAADSTSTETKHFAKSLLGLLPKLQNSLSVRIDREEKEPTP